MKKYKAVRLSLTEAQIIDDAEKLLCVIQWPAAKFWRTENAPLSDSLGESFQTDFTLIVEGRKLTAKRKLLTNKFFFNEYEISLFDESNQRLALAFDPGLKWSIKIDSDGKNYELKRYGFFQFCFSLEEGGKKVAQFTDTTSFFTFSSRREFLITDGAATPPFLISFSFFMAHNWFF
jgi:hypothetical protein